MTGQRTRAQVVGAALAAFNEATREHHLNMKAHAASQMRREDAKRALLLLLEDRKPVAIGGLLLRRLGASLNVEPAEIL